MASSYSTVLPEPGDIVPATIMQGRWVQNTGTSWSDIVNVTGSGYLLSIQAADAGDIRLRVTIDSNPSSELQGETQSNLMQFTGPARFRSALRVEIRRNSGSGGEEAAVQYSLDQ